MDFLKMFSSKTTPKEVAKDKIRKEILEVISKYIEIDVGDVEISLSRSEDIEGDGGPALIANIPIKNLKGR